jgi:hypothetical protein
MHLALSDPSIRRKRHESVMSLVMGSGPTCMTFRHRHFKLSSLIETVEMGQEDEEDEPWDQKSPVAGVQWSRKGGYVLFVRRKAPWKKNGCEIEPCCVIC